MNSAPDSRQEIAARLAKLDEQINALRVEFEQYFAGVIRFQPEKLKADVEREFRQMLKIPLKNAEHSFKVKSLKYRFNTLDSYWRRILREKEEGRYHKDVFKANFKHNLAESHRKSHTKEGALDKQLQSVYKLYKKCMSDNGQEQAAVSFEAFKTSLSQRASSLKKNNPGKKVKFSLVVKNGLPSVEAQIKEVG